MTQQSEEACQCFQIKSTIWIQTEQFRTRAWVRDGPRIPYVRHNNTGGDSLLTVRLRCRKRRPGGTLMIIVLGHLVTIPTVLAVSEIATNRRVAGGGAYYIVSRSFGTSIGGAIGLALYLSQAISVAFYMVAFAEAFGPVL